MKKEFKSLFILSFISLATFLTSCGGDKDESEPDFTVTVNPSSLTLANEIGSSQTFNVECEGDWNIIGGDASWLSVSPSSGRGFESVEVRATSENTTNSDRSANLTVMCGQNRAYLTVTQKIGLRVSPTQVNLPSEKDKPSNITIQCSGNWNLEGCPEWLHVSAQAGIGTTVVTLTALSDNNTSHDREAILKVYCDGQSSEIKIIQTAGLKSSCNISVRHQVILEESMAFYLNFGQSVSYYYVVYAPKSYAPGNTDATLLEWINKYGTRQTEKSGCFSMEIEAITDYIVYAVGYDENDQRGEIMRHEMNYVYSSNPPIAELPSSIKYWATNSAMEVEITPNPACASYLIGFFEDYYGSSGYNQYCDAELALFMDLDFDFANVEEYTNGGKLTLFRNDVNDKYVTLVTWAKDRKDTPSSVIDRSTYYLNSSSKVADISQITKKFTSQPKTMGYENMKFSKFPNGFIIK